MKISCFPEKIDQKRAMAMADKQTGFFSRLFIGRDKKIEEVKTLYIENRLITFTITAKPPLFEKLFKKEPKPIKSRIQMIANGSTCGVAYYDPRGVEIVEEDIDEEHVQKSDYADELLITRGNALARKILRRRVGGNLTLEVEDIKSVYRPYHVAFYGKPAAGSKVYYVPIAADMCSVGKTF